MIELRPITRADAPAVAAAVHQSRDALRRWMEWYRDDYDVHTATSWIDYALADAAAGTGQAFAILNDAKQLVGIIGFEDISEQSDRAMIGYWLATPASGQGIGRRAIALALAWARTQQQLRVIWAIVADANLASRRVLELNDFRYVGQRGVDERGDRALLYELDLRAP